MADEVLQVVLEYGVESDRLSGSSLVDRVKGAFDGALAAVGEVLAGLPLHKEDNVDGQGKQ